MADSFNSFQEWRRQGVELRRAMEAELQELLQRVKELQSAIAALPPAAQETKDDNPFAGLRVVHGRIISTAAPVPQFVEAAVSASAKPLTAREIIEKVQSMKSDVSAANIHSAIFRLQKSGRLVPSGNRGERTYNLPERIEAQNGGGA